MTLIFRMTAASVIFRSTSQDDKSNATPVDGAYLHQKRQRNR
jgi:hypothetical protein